MNDKGKAKTHSTDVIPTVSSIRPDGTIIELVYDPVAETTALVVGRPGDDTTVVQEVTLNSGERLVPYSPNNNLIANGCVMLPSAPEDFGTKADLLSDIKAFLHRYVDVSPLFEDIAAHYVLLTWVYERFNELPYLRFRGDYGTGKTRALIVLGSLCYKAFFASGASTVSPIFHVLDTFGGTLILDESDMPFSDATTDLVKILNNGTMPGIPVLRTVVNRHKEFNPYAFKVYGPKILGMRGAFQDEALESRFLTEHTGRRSLREDIPISLPRQARPEALRLRNRLLDFRLKNFWTMQTDVSAKIDGIEPRLNQMALSLLSLVEGAALRQQIQNHLVEENANLVSDRRDTLCGAVLEATVNSFAVASGGSVALRDIVQRFNLAHASEFGTMSSRMIGHVLRKQLHLRPRKSNGIYVVSASDKKVIDALAVRIGL